MTEQDLLQAAKWLASARRIVEFSGAGLSKESGISTFRGEGGLWSKFFNLSLAYFGTPFGWSLTPKFSWTMYLKHFLVPIVRAQPNPAHFAISEMERLVKSSGGDTSSPVEFCVITQNVDGLHQRAGTPHEKVYELHGTIWRHRCSKRGHPYPQHLQPAMPSGSTPQDSESTEAILQHPFLTQESRKVPRCVVEGCGSCLRPDCTLFMESLPEDTWNRAHKAVAKLQEGDCLIVVGTSGVVYPAASLPEIARFHDVHCIEVNPNPSTFTLWMDIFFPAPAGEVLPKLVKELEKVLKANTRNN